MVFHSIVFSLSQLVFRAICDTHQLPVAFAVEIAECGSLVRADVESSHHGRSARRNDDRSIVSADRCRGASGRPAVAGSAPAAATSCSPYVAFVTRLRLVANPAGKPVAAVDRHLRGLIASVGADVNRALAQAT
jgi:hypothetical protein